MTAVAPVLTGLGHGLTAALAMFWQTLWALVLGFALSGAVQSFVSRARLRRSLGNHRPAAVLRASGYGMASSSCSYAASALTKSLVAKGADVTSSLVFLVASTNLVVELGVVLVVLLGWQFATAEFVGGPIMIVLVALAGGAVFTPAVVDRARRHLRGAAGRTDDRGGSDDGDTDGTPLRAALRSPAAWADASGYAVADATMLRRELVVGYLVAGFLATLVPAHLWGALFLHGHGAWTTVENALVGPLIAVASWVCSVGNVPLAAALWSGGISFGGVVAFLFGDLISLPLLLVYRRMFGTAMTLRMAGLLYAVMVVAGLATQALFAAVGALPTRRTVDVSTAHVGWGVTTALDVVALVAAGVIWWTARHRDRWGAGVGYATDPVCGMQVRTAEAPAVTTWAGRPVHFCSDRCLERFTADHAPFTGGGPSGTAGGGAVAHACRPDDGGRDGCRGPASAAGPVPVGGVPATPGG